jgi:hypothetical protein
MSEPTKKRSKTSENADPAESPEFDLDTSPEHAQRLVDAAVASADRSRSSD